MEALLGTARQPVELSELTGEDVDLWNGLTEEDRALAAVSLIRAIHHWAAKRKTGIQNGKFDPPPTMERYLLSVDAIRLCRESYAHGQTDLSDSIKDAAKSMRGINDPLAKLLVEALDFALLEAPRLQ